MTDGWPPRPVLQPVHWDAAARAGVALAVLRLDAIDPLLSGNKWYKLAPQIARLQSEGWRGILSLGGAHSNHLHALAAAGQRFGFATTGLLRGLEQDTPTVRDLRSCGMQLHWLGYAGYRQRHQPGFSVHWQALYPGHLYVDEGGMGLEAVHSCAGLIDLLQQALPQAGWHDYDQLWVACGTGTTLAGLILGDAGRHAITGGLAVPAGHGVELNVPGLLAEAGCSAGNWRLRDASLGAFARTTPQLLACMAAFEQQTGVLLEPLYTGKLVLALRGALAAGEIQPGSRIVLLHGGGLQGRRGMGLSAAG